VFVNRVLGIVILSCVALGLAQAAPVATYSFNNNLNALEGGVPALVAVDPMGSSTFVQKVTVFGHQQTVWQFNGANNPPADQGGLTLNTSGLIPSNNYSVEMVFELFQGTNAWRRILDALDRQSDSGFYVDPSNTLDVFPAPSSGGTFTTGSFFDVFLTVDSSNNVTGYLSGLQEFSTNTTVMDIDSNNTLGFFLDNLVGGGQGEWSNGDIALLKVYNTALTADQVLAETADPFATVIPEPGTWVLMLAGAGALAFQKLRR
jgi:hypothetical protein